MINLKQILFGLTFGFAVSVAPVMAEQEQEQEQEQSPANTEVTDQQLEQFVEALREVRELGQLYSEEIAEAESSEQAQELQRQAQTEMVAAVENAGLTVQEYNTIAERMSQDAALRKRVEDML